MTPVERLEKAMQVMDELQVKKKIPEWLMMKNM